MKYVVMELHALYIWDEIASMIPTGINFGANVEYEDRVRSFDLLVASLPKIGGWKPTATPPDLDGVAQSRLDAMEIDEPSAHVSVERWIEEPGRELQEYRFRFNNMRRALIRDALISLIDQAFEEQTKPPPTWADSPQVLAALRSCIERLPARSRQMLHLRYWDELRADDIGDQVGLAGGAVRLALLRIREGLIRCLRSTLGTTEWEASW